MYTATTRYSHKCLRLELSGSRWQRQWNSGDHILPNVHDLALAVEPASESDLRAGQPANTWLHPRQVRIRPSRGAADLPGLLWLIRWKCENVQPTLEVENRKPTACTKELLTSWLCVTIQLDRQYTKQAEQYTDLTAHLNHPHSFSEIKVNNDHVWFRSQPDPRKQLIRTCTEYAGPRHTSHPKHVKPPFSNIQNFVAGPALREEQATLPFYHDHIATKQLRHCHEIFQACRPTCGSPPTNDRRSRMHIDGALHRHHKSAHLCRLVCRVSIDSTRYSWESDALQSMFLAE